MYFCIFARPSPFVDREPDGQTPPSDAPTIPASATLKSGPHEPRAR